MDKHTRRPTVKFYALVPAFLCLCAVWAMLPLDARAELRIDITQGNVEPLPLAIATFAAEGIAAGEIARIADTVIKHNLINTGLFRLIEPVDGASLTTPAGAPDFAAWRRFGADALVVGEVAYRRADDSFEIAFRLFDLHTGRQVTAFNYLAARENSRRVAHLMSDAIYHRLTGEEGYFDSRIVFIGESGSKIGRSKSLMIMDQDGHNLRSLLPGGSGDIIITPRFNPAAQEITYVSYEEKAPGVYIYNLQTGQHERVGGLDLASFAPRFSPDGKKLVMSLPRGGNTNLFTFDIRTQNLEAVSNSPSIDTSPSYSPDGKFITFESDRGGSQQIYVMRADGTRPRRISADRRAAYGTPVWSPRGDLIAFTKQEGGEFLIGIMRIDGSGERILTKNYHNEAPVWSPNGRILLFFRESRGEAGGPHIWSIDLTGENEKRIKTPSFASDPAWSPPLPPPVPLQ